MRDSNRPVTSSTSEHPPVSSRPATIHGHIDHHGVSPSVYEDAPVNPPMARTPPVILGCSEDSRKTTLITHYPKYSTDAKFLESMLKEQCSFPPTFIVRISGTRHAARDDSNATTMTDFDIIIDMTYLLPPKPRIRATTEASNNEYRLSSDIERGYDASLFWCERYTSDRSIAKRFKFTRRVYFDQKKLEERILSLVQHMKYAGVVQVSYSIEDKNIVILSPGLINRCRTTWQIYIWFYITFLWIFTWPLLLWITADYEVLTAQYHAPHNSEDDFFEFWKDSIKGAILRKKKGLLYQEFRRRTG